MLQYGAYGEEKKVRREERKEEKDANLKVGINNSIFFSDSASQRGL
jgi:hypothetical protein